MVGFLNDCLESISILIYDYKNKILHDSVVVKHFSNVSSKMSISFFPQKSIYNQIVQSQYLELIGNKKLKENLASLYEHLNDRNESANLKLDQFNFNGLDRYMEGEFRENHFAGVATVVSKLFSLIKADYAYFGEKDFQQLRIIENLIKEKKFNVKLIRCETIRSKDGLALSSRNNKLNFSSKKIATNLFKALNFAKEKIDVFSTDEIEQKVFESLSNFKEIKLEYFVIADEKNLKPIKHKQAKRYRAFIAAYVSGVRLIDNVKLY